MGAGRHDLEPVVDAVGWVQSDAAEAERRGIARDVAAGRLGDVTQVTAFWREWEAQERPFLARERPWERACVVVAGTPTVPHSPGEVVLAPPPRLRG